LLATLWSKAANLTGGRIVQRGPHRPRKASPPSCRANSPSAGEPRFGATATMMLGVVHDDRLGLAFVGRSESVPQSAASADWACDPTRRTVGRIHWSDRDDLHVAAKEKGKKEKSHWLHKLARSLRHPVDTPSGDVSGASRVAAVVMHRP
jgi:hypothetical protein